MRFITSPYESGPEVIKLFSGPKDIKLFSVEHEILNAHKYKNTKKFGFFFGLRLTMAKFRSCLMIEYVYTCLNMICLSVIMIANHVLVTCLTIKHDQDANEFYQCKNIICSLDYHC